MTSLGCLGSALALPPTSSELSMDPAHLFGFFGHGSPVWPSSPQYMQM